MKSNKSRKTKKQVQKQKEEKTEEVKYTREGAAPRERMRKTIKIS